MVTMIQKCKNKEEQDICKLLISWINDGSHNFADDLFIEIQDDTIEKYLSVLNKDEEKILKNCRSIFMRTPCVRIDVAINKLTGSGEEATEGQSIFLIG